MNKHIKTNINRNNIFLKEVLEKLKFNLEMTRSFKESNENIKGNTNKAYLKPYVIDDIEIINSFFETKLEEKKEFKLLKAEEFKEYLLKGLRQLEASDKGYNLIIKIIGEIK